MVLIAADSLERRLVLAMRRRSCRRGGERGITSRPPVVLVGLTATDCPPGRLMVEIASDIAT
jgi:hypothetical protein